MRNLHTDEIINNIREMCIEANILLAILYYFFFSLCFGAYDILGKKYMINFFKTPYFFMFIIGLINSILILIYELFAYFINRDVSGITKGFQNNILDVGNVFLFILDLLVQSIWNLGIWLLKQMKKHKF